MEDSNKAYDTDFSNYYDRITKHKDYRSEVNTLVRVIQQMVAQPGPRILDVGCGTGNHATLLAEAGYDITAIDLSPDMIRIADNKTPDVKFKCGDIAKLEDTGFHFCYSLFNVINCLDSMETLIRFFKAIFSRLNDGGVFFVEAWNPIAVIAVPPEVVERTYEYEDETIRRKVVPFEDFLNQRLELKYFIEVYNTKTPDAKPHSFDVTHRLLLFTPLEIQYCLDQAGFKEVKTYTALPDMAPATASDRMLAFTSKK